MSLERGCRERLEQTEDGRQALRLLDASEWSVALLGLVRGICELRTASYRSTPPTMLENALPWRELGFVEICATLGVEWLPDQWKKPESAPLGFDWQRP